MQIYKVNTQKVLIDDHWVKSDIENILKQKWKS